MKHLTKIFAPLLIFLFVAGNISAQSEEHPLLVVSFQKVKMGDIGTVNGMINEIFAPILNKLVDEGMLYGWGLFNHSWGDEWNVNVWYTAKDLSSFDKFWDEYIKRVSEKHPDAFSKLTSFVMEHKDNIYSIQNQYPLPPGE